MIVVLATIFTLELADAITKIDLSAHTIVGHHLDGLGYFRPSHGMVFDKSHIFRPFLNWNTLIALSLEPKISSFVTYLVEYYHPPLYLSTGFLEILNCDG